jgi:hypothetical protein
MRNSLHLVDDRIQFWDECSKITTDFYPYSSRNGLEKTPDITNSKTTVRIPVRLWRAFSEIVVTIENEWRIPFLISSTELWDSMMQYATAN